MTDDSSVSQKVIEYIQLEIMERRLKSGDKIPSERHFTEQLGVSRPLVREALSALELLGIIKKVQGYGTFVAEFDNKNIFEPLSVAFMLKKGSMLEVLDFRGSIEEYSAQAACDCATAGDIAELNDIHDKFLNETDINKKAMLDLTFHFKVISMGKNSLMIDFMQSVLFLMKPLFLRSIEIVINDPPVLQDTYDEHFNIIRAIELRDKKKALQAVKVHFGGINKGRIVFLSNHEYKEE